MGLIYTTIELINSDDLALAKHGYLSPQQVRRITVTALVDSGAYMLVIPPAIALQLDLPKMAEQITEIADGSQLKLEVVGPVEIHFENRTTVCRALVLPGSNEVLLGAIPLEDMDVVIDFKQQQLKVNPTTPYLAKTFVKTLKCRETKFLQET